jgi:hypothetical protein
VCLVRTPFQSRRHQSVPNEINILRPERRLRAVRDRNDVRCPQTPQQTQARPAEARLLSMSVPAGETAAGKVGLIPNSEPVS